LVGAVAQVSYAVSQPKKSCSSPWNESRCGCLGGIMGVVAFVTSSALNTGFKI